MTKSKRLDDETRLVLDEFRAVARNIRECCNRHESGNPLVRIMALLINLEFEIEEIEGQGVQKTAVILLCIKNIAALSKLTG